MGRITRDREGGGKSGEQRQKRRQSGGERGAIMSRTAPPPPAPLGSGVPLVPQLARCQRSKHVFICSHEDESVHQTDLWGCFSAPLFPFCPCTLFRHHRLLPPKVSGRPPSFVTASARARRRARRSTRRPCARAGASAASPAHQEAFDGYSCLGSSGRS